jgi:predicted DNA-binding transcriptional regulator YafY
MANLDHPTSPLTQQKANAEVLRLAVRLLREAGDKGLTREALAKGLGKSPRQVNRVVEVLADQGATFDKQRLTNNGASVVVYRLVQGPAWDESISPHALTALRLAFQALEQVGSEIWADHLQTFQELAGHHLTSRDRIFFASLAGRVGLRGTVTDPQLLDPDILAEVIRALGAPNGPMQLEVTYAPPGRDSWTRAVCPYTLTHDAFGGGAFLLVWDLERTRAIHLRLNRIEQAHALSRPGLVPDERPLRHAAAYQIGGWFEAAPPFPVVVRVKGRTWPQALLESPPALPEVSVDQEETTVQVQFLATEPYAPARWALQFGGDAEVLEPPAVRDLVRQRLVDALAQYPS